MDASRGESGSPGANVPADGATASGEPINAGAGRTSPTGERPCPPGLVRRPVGCVSLAYLPLPTHALLGPNDLVRSLGGTFGPGDVEAPGSR